MMEADMAAPGCKRVVGSTPAQFAQHIKIINELGITAG